jgi:hypothetical protein
LAKAKLIVVDRTPLIVKTICNDCGEEFTFSRMRRRQYYCPSCNLPKRRQYRYRHGLTVVKPGMARTCGRDYLTVPIDEPCETCGAIHF